MMTANMCQFFLFIRLLVDHHNSDEPTDIDCVIVLVALLFFVNTALWLDVVRHSVAGDAKKLSPQEATADCRRLEQPPATSALLPQPHATSRAVETEACTIARRRRRRLGGGLPEGRQRGACRRFPTASGVGGGLHAEVREGNFAPVGGPSELCCAEQAA